MNSIFEFRRVDDLVVLPTPPAFVYQCAMRTVDIKNLFKGGRKMELTTLETTKEYVKLATIETILIAEVEDLENKLNELKSNVDVQIEAYNIECKKLEELKAKIAKAYADKPLPIEQSENVEVL